MEDVFGGSILFYPVRGAPAACGGATGKRTKNAFPRGARLECPTCQPADCASNFSWRYSREQISWATLRAGGPPRSTSSRPAPRRNRQTLHRRRRVRRGFPRGPCALSHQQRTHLRPVLLQRQHHLLCLVRQLGLGEHRHAGAWRWRRVAEAACRSDPISGQILADPYAWRDRSARRQWVRGHAGAVCTARTGT